MRLILPEKVNYIIEELMANGHEAYAVGGCVRDSLLERIPGDWDITTSANPYEVKQIFPRTIDTGIAHGTVTVMLGKEGFEVTTYRLDGEYEDNRHPKQVEYTKNLIEDLKRRDFTINAMAYNHEQGLVDAFEGLLDLKEKKIRCVGSARQRFDEDALRILRAVRFSAQLDFSIEEETLLAIREKALNLKNISAERIREELNKLLLSDYPERLFVAYETGLTKVVLPEFDQMLQEEREYCFVRYNVGRHALTSLHYFASFMDQKEEDKKQQLIYRWAILLHGVKEPEEAKAVLRRLKFDNETIDSVTKLVSYFDTTFVSQKQELRRAANVIGEKFVPMLFLLKEYKLRALLFAHCENNKTESDSEEKYFFTESNAQKAITEEIEHLKKAKMQYEEIIEDGDCISLKMLAINGKDLMELGYQPGKNIGIMLEQLLDQVLEKPSLNTKEQLVKLIQVKND